MDLRRFVQGKYLIDVKQDGIEVHIGYISKTYMTYR